MTGIAWPDEASSQTQLFLAENQIGRRSPHPYAGIAEWDNDSISGRIDAIVDCFNSETRYLKGRRIRSDRLRAAGGFTAGVISAVTGSPLASIGYALADATLVEEISNRTFDAYKKQSLDLLAMCVSEVFDHQPTAQELIRAYQTAEETGNMRMRTLLDRHNVFLQASWQGIDPDAAGVVSLIWTEKLSQCTGQMIQELADHGAQIKQHWGSIAALDDKVRDNSVDIVKAGLNAKLNFADTLVGIEQTHVQLRRISDRINFQERSILKNRADIDFLQSFMFNKLDPKDQIHFLEEKLEANRSVLSAEESQTLQEQLSCLKQKEKTFDNLQLIANSGQGLINIAQSLGIEVPRELQIAAKVTSALPKMFKDLSKGNYLGVITGLGSLCGIFGRRKSASAARHEQVMRALAQLQRGQQQIMRNQQLFGRFCELFQRNQGLLLENQRHIYNAIEQVERTLIRVQENQQQIYNGIQHVSQQLERHHHDMMVKLAEITHQITINRFSILNVVEVKIIQCSRALEKLLQHPGFDRANNRFNSFVLLKDFYERDAQFYLREGLPGLLERMHSAGTTNDVAFRLSSVESQRSTIAPYLQHYGRSYLFLKNRLQNNSLKLEKALLSLIDPVRTIPDLNDKLSTIENAPEVQLPVGLEELLSQDPEIGNTDTSTLLADPYDANRVLKFVNLAVRFHYFFELMKKYQPSEGLAELGEIRNRQIYSPYGKDMLEDALIRVDITIAQQSLFAGDILLKHLADTLDDQNADQSIIDEAKAIINDNVILAENLVKYMLYNKFNQSQAPLWATYTNALSSNQPNALANLLPPHMSPVSNTDPDIRSRWGQDADNNRWFVKISEQVFPLPTAYVLEHEHRLINTSEVDALMDMRQRVLNELMGYQAPNLIYSRQQRQLYSYLLTSSAGLLNQ